MVDFSNIFILFTYVRGLLISVGIDVDFDDSWFAILIVLLGLAFVFGLIGLIKKNRKDANHYNMKKFFLVIAGIFLFAAAIVALGVQWPYIESFITTYIPINGALLDNLTIILCGFVILIFFLVSGFRADKTPNNESLMNRRQSRFTAAAILAIALTGYIFFTINESVFANTMSVIMFIAELASILFWFYDPIILIISKVIKIPPKTTYEPTPSKLNRFAVLGCAHNEGDVIEQLIKSLYATVYPKNSYDIYIICDNCTDNTAEVSRRAGAIAMERHDPDHRGKGFGLQWMFDHLDEERQKGNEYDAYIILDADNLVNESFFDEINTKMNEGYEILQAYLGCKNPSDTWVSKCYSYAYWVSDEMYQEAHSRVGLTAQMGGTGMVLRPSVLDDIGWHTDSLTEDLVLTSRYVLEKDLPCCWVENARLYDEKPLKIKPSIKQRTRWMQGHMDAMFRFAPKLFWSSIKNRSLKQFDMAFYLARPCINLILVATYLVRLLFNILLPASPLASAFIMGIDTSTVLLISTVFLQSYLLYNEFYGRYVHWWLLQLVFTFSWYPAIFRGLIKRNEKYWLSTVHTRNLSNKDVREDDLLLEAKERLQGLDNVHRLPLGQILLKAAVITRPQLEKALDIQKEAGGYLGDIIVETDAISAETLDTYLSIQKEMRELAQSRDTGREDPLIGELLVEAGLITAGQVNVALEYQAEHGGFFGEAVIATHSLPVDLLQAFLSVQKVLDMNYVTKDSAKHLMNGLMLSRNENLGTILYNGGLISAQQLKLALELQQTNGKPIGETLVELDFITRPALEAILEFQADGRTYVQHKQQSDLYLSKEAKPAIQGEVSHD